MMEGKGREFYPIRKAASCPAMAIMDLCGNRRA
jgi:hypothetical protein